MHTIEPGKDLQIEEFILYSGRKKDTENLYYLSDAFPFFVARKETDRIAYCFSLSNK